MNIHEIRWHAYCKQELSFKKDIYLLQVEELEEELQDKDTVSVMYNLNTAGASRIFCM